MCVLVPKHAGTAAPAAPGRLHRAACVLVARTVGFCGKVLAGPGVLGRGWELALATDTDLSKMVECEVSDSLL